MKKLSAMGYSWVHREIRASPDHILSPKPPNQDDRIKTHPGPKNEFF